MRLAGWLLLLAACGTGAPVAQEDEALPERALSDSRFAFCHAPHSLQAGVEEPFCALVEDDPVARRYCPGLAAACGEGPATGTTVEPPQSGCQEAPASGTPTDLPFAGEDNPAPPPRPEMSCDDASAGLGALLRWVAAIAVAVMVLVFLRVAMHFMGTGREEEVVVQAEQARVVPVTVAEDEVPDIPSNDLLEAAGRALAEGRFGDVLLLTRATVLRALADARHVRLHRSRTDREYARQVRREPALHEPLQGILGSVERHRWGGWVADADSARSALDAARRLLSALGPLVLLLAVLGAGPITLRYGVEYDAGLLRAFQLADYEASWRMRPLADLDAAETDMVVVDLSGLQPSEESWDGLRAFAEDGGVVVIGGDPTGEWDLLGDYVELDASSTPSRTDYLKWDVELPVWPSGPYPALHGADSDGYPLAEVDGDALIYVLPSGAGAVVVIADERLLWNGALVSGPNERLWGHLWEQLVQLELVVPVVHPVVELATLSAMTAEGGGGGGSSDSPVQSMLNANVLPFVLQLLLVLGLAALWKGTAFAPLKDPPEHGRDRFVDHVEALGLRYARLGASGYALRQYTQWALARYGRLGLINAAVRAGRPRDEAQRFVAQLEEIAGEDEPQNGPRDLTTMEELWTLIRSTKSR